jgi:hypothetical protein
MYDDFSRFYVLKVHSFPKKNKRLTNDDDDNEIHRPSERLITKYSAVDLQAIGGLSRSLESLLLR